jgi:D-glycero-D-manno-heptose 1,7-bisphosphate phosphatase
MKLVILDRDGVVNVDSDDYVKSAAEWTPIPGSIEAIARLYRAGWRVFIATNQSGLARGLFDLDALAEMHAKLHRLVDEHAGAVDGIAYCPHGPDDGCECRKPKPGLYLEIAQRLDCALAGVPVVGDSERDLQPARALGARPILVRTGKGKQTLDTHPELADGEVFDDLSAVADQLLSEEAGGS